MLKCLELVGFKSFADKTRIDFNAGITAIVGPNGSGKSNVVDAIKWILGEQSAKSLRGKEMVDVIFNGSGSRRPLGLASVSLTLNNQAGVFPLDAAEIVLTRRVYRTGEGEYLINGQPARLRDIKNLFLGTGAAAYSIIEQGKVEMLLQSSTKDRRQIFEEAAGISRFRARKIETLRRLDRVEQNLLRVHDISDEVDKQLRGLRVQAGRAQKYIELTEEQKSLRVTLALIDFHAATKELDALEAESSELQKIAGSAAATLDESQRRFAEADASITEQEELVRRSSDELTRLRELTSALESETTADLVREAELADEQKSVGLELDEQRKRLIGLDRQIAAARSRMEDENHSLVRADEGFRAHDASFQKLGEALGGLRAELARGRESQAAVLKAIARSENEQAALESQATILWQQSKRASARQVEAAAMLDKLRREHSTSVSQCLSIQTQTIRLESRLQTLRQEQARLQRLLHEQSEHHSKLRDARSNLSGRIEALRAMQERHEGLGGGVRTALEQRESGDTRWQAVVGVFVNCLETSAEYADAIELALGPAAQALVVARDADLNETLLAAARALPGRVLFISLEREQAADSFIVCSDEIDGAPLSAQVKCSDEFRPLVSRLLDATYLAADTNQGRKWAATSVGMRFITPEGDVLDADGSLGVGPVRATTGTLARGAELKELDARVAQIERELGAAGDSRSAIDVELLHVETALSSHRAQESALVEQRRHFETIAAKIAQKLQAIEVELEAAASEKQRSVSELGEVQSQLRAVESALNERHDEMKRLSETVHTAEAALAEMEQQLAQTETRRAGAQQSLAVLKERIAALSEQIARLSEQRDRQHAETLSKETRLKNLGNRRGENARRWLDNTSRLASAYWDRQRKQAESGVDPVQLAELRHVRKQLADLIERERFAFDRSKGRLHEIELRLTSLRMGRETQSARMREDYGVNLAELHGESYAPPGDFEPENARARVADLKDKIARLGNVNLDAAKELQEIEQRYGNITVHVNDLTTAKRHLEEVIGKINEESRRLFLDTFEAVRTHFQEIFRKLFGGGKADLILEDETDILETGIEVIARPPGKEPRSISLLSGGEKTMTAVALLMALFRSKPSPFCVLDEVDAALDEANIGRFVGLLREYLNISQFLLVTHSKTTMAAADVLHGVTQRESGVSTRISIRLDDVADDGNLLETAGSDEPVLSHS